MLPLADSPLGLITIWTELLRDIVIEIVQKLCLPVPPVIDSLLEFHIVLERQIFLDLRVFYSRILRAGIWSLKYPVDLIFPLSQFRDLLEYGLYPFQSINNLLSVYLRYNQALEREFAFPE
jgi:hypothetical protein